VSRGLRRWLAVAIAVCAAAIAGVSLLSPPASANAPACPQRYCPTPVPKHTPTPPDPTGPATPAPEGSVQAIVAPTPTPFDDTKATPGPIVGTQVTPQSVLSVPVGAPSVTAHPQPEGGLTALLIVGGILALLCLGTFTFAIALK